MADFVEKVPSTEPAKIMVTQVDIYIRPLLPSWFVLERPTSRLRSATRPPASQFRKRFPDVETIWLAKSTDFFNKIDPCATSRGEPGMSAFEGEAVVPQTSTEVRV